MDLTSGEDDEAWGAGHLVQTRTGGTVKKRRKVSRENKKRRLRLKDFNDTGQVGEAENKEVTRSIEMRLELGQTKTKELLELRKKDGLEGDW